MASPAGPFAGPPPLAQEDGTSPYLQEAFVHSLPDPAEQTDLADPSKKRKREDDEHEHSNAATGGAELPDGGDLVQMLDASANADAAAAGAGASAAPAAGSPTASVTSSTGPSAGAKREKPNFQVPARELRELLTSSSAALGPRDRNASKASRHAAITAVKQAKEAERMELSEKEREAREEHLRLKREKERARKEKQREEQARKKEVALNHARAMAIAQGREIDAAQLEAEVMDQLNGQAAGGKKVPKKAAAKGKGKSATPAGAPQASASGVPPVTAKAKSKKPAANTNGSNIAGTSGGKSKGKASKLSISTNGAVASTSGTPSTSASYSLDGAARPTPAVIYDRSGFGNGYQSDEEEYRPLVAPQASVIAQAQRDTGQDQGDEEADDRLYCICQRLYDPERLMIACDRCDNWYHTDCIHIDEADIPLIDHFICPLCEKETPQRTTYKTRCAREGCNSAAVKHSKYCSDWCGIAVAASRLDLARDDLDVERLYEAISGSRKVEALVSERVNGTLQMKQRSQEEDDRKELELLQDSLARSEAKRRSIEAALHLSDSRLSYLHLAIARFDTLTSAYLLANPAPLAKPNRRKVAAAVMGNNTDAPCGFDVRLVWDDKDFLTFITSEQGTKVLGVLRKEMMNQTRAKVEGRERTQEELEEALREEQGEEGSEDGLVCTLARRKCDRHTGWQKTREADYEVEKSVLTRRLEGLNDSQRRIQQKLNDLQDLMTWRAKRAQRTAMAEDIHRQLQLEQRREASIPIQLDGDEVMEVDASGAEAGIRVVELPVDA